MDFYIDLNEDWEHHWQTERKIMIAAVVVLSIVCILNIIVTKNHFNRIVYIALLLCYVVSMAYSYRIRIRTKYYVRSDAQMLEYKLHAMDRLKQQLLWESIEHVKFGATYVGFYKRTGKRKQL
ncbi:MAG: hypothetical protein IKI28_10180, partial [Bacteroidales bacterium]|nr:hypothetical protein [Bacteroidales bacterium]